MSFKTASAIIRGQWAIQKEYAESMMPLVMQLLNGEATHFPFAQAKEDNQAPPPLPLAMAAGVYGVGRRTDLSQLPQGSIAVMDLIGPVMKYGDYCSYGSADHAALVSRLAASPNVSGIILNIDSPGGQVAGTTMLADAIKAATSRKPVVAMIDDGIAASAAMWIASAANEIYTTKKSDAVGSIGVFYTLADFSGMYEQKGIKVRQVYATASTEKNGEIREALKGNDEPLIAELDATADDFFSVITRNRGARLTSEAWKTGRMFRAKEAQKIGLIDGIKSFDQIIKRVQAIQKNNTMSLNTTQSSAEQNTGNPLAVAGDNQAGAFAHILAAAGIEAITVCDDGFAMDETAMNNLEQLLGTHVGEREALQQQITELQQQLQQRDALQLQVDQLTATNATQTTRITELQQRVQELEAKPDGSFSQTVKPADDLGSSGKAKFHTSVDDEAERLRGLRGK